MYWQIIIICTLLAIIIPAFRARLRYFAAYLIYAVVVMSGALVCSVQFYLKGEPSYENSCKFTKFYLLARTLIGLRPRVFGLETHDPKQQYIYVINHQSFIDVLSLVDLWKFPSTVIAKSSLRYFGPLGLILYYTKTILIHRANHEQAISEMDRAANQIINDKVNLFVFPEGTRSYSGHLLPFKKGAFHLAIQTQLPIQPVVVSCYNSFLDHRKFSFTPVPYGVYLLPPIPTAGMDKSQVNELAERTRAAMSDVFDLTARAPPEELGKDLRKKD